MKTYGAIDWDKAMAMPLVRAWALYAMAQVFDGLAPAAPPYGQRARLDAMTEYLEAGGQIDLPKISRGTARRART